MMQQILDSIDDFDKVKVLVEALENPKVVLNQLSPQDMSPLIMASFKGYVETVKLLLKNGADPNFVNSKQLSPLMAACDQGSKDRVNFTHKQVVELLIDAGATINLNGMDGFTPLLFAVDDGSLEIVELLLRHGADVKQVNNNKSAYVQDGHFTSFKYRGWGPLHHAAYRGWTTIAKLLIDSGADVNQRAE